VEGDFAVQVRVAGDFRQGRGRAGLLVLAGDQGVTLSLEARSREGQPQPFSSARFFDRAGGRAFDGFVDLPGQAGTLRLERRGRIFRTRGDLDGRGWKTWEETDGGLRFPRKVKVGVFAEATAQGSFQVAFDQFKLTVPAKQRGGSLAR
jgi:regulation of enolase protein 1 (concanavalin A-like superfamily)